MGQRDSLPALPAASSSLAASDILEMARSHCKPRVSLSQMAKTRAERTQQNTPAPVSDIHYNAKRLVMLTIAVPFLSTISGYSMLGFNYRSGNAAKAEAIQKKLLVEHHLHSGRQGGKMVLLEPSKAAFAMFKMPSMYDNPGFLHRYLQHEVKKTMAAQGFKVTLEKRVKGKNIDVVLEREDEKVAVEIAVTDKHEVINVGKDIFQAGFDKVVIIGKDRKIVAAVKKKISTAFDSDTLSKVRCCVLADFVDGKMK